ncbi:MAG: hypothetical protein LAT57_13715 [Balneolales bacterium]|nr:hypothetical protein [Balneolales bacterium]
MKNTLFCLVLFCCLLAPETAIFAQTAGSESPDRDAYAIHEFSARGISNITLRPGQGNISVHGTNSDTVRIEVYVMRRGIRVLQGDRIDDDYRLIFRQRGREIQGEISHVRGTVSSSNAPSFNFVVFAPYQSNMSLATASGNIEVVGIKGNVEVRVGQGNIKTEGGSGSMRLYSAAGNTSVDTHQGVLFTNTVAGNVQLDRIQGETRIRVVSGNTKLHEMQGDVLAHIINGNIDFNMLQIDNLVDLETVNGNISALLEMRQGINLNIEGQRVNLSQIRNFDGDIRQNRVTGDLEGGGPAIRMKTTVGRIDLDIQQ